MKLSGFVICCNEEKQIERCLRSLSFCDEIILIDSGSTDRTLEIAKPFCTKIIYHPWNGFVKQKTFGFNSCSGEWVLNVDSDEVVTPELAANIQKVITDKNSDAGYLLNRVVFFRGKFWRKGGWHPEYRLRLCKRALTTWGGEDPHEKAMVDGKTSKLEGELQHYTYDSYQDQVHTLTKHTQDAAQNLFQKKKSANFFDIITRPIVRFIKFYFLRKGILEGIDGLFVAVLEAYYVYLKYLFLYELHHHHRVRSYEQTK